MNFQIKRQDKSARKNRAPATYGWSFDQDTAYTAPAKETPKQGGFHTRTVAQSQPDFY